MAAFEELESNVRVYSRVFRDVFCKAQGSLIYAESGKKYIDFFAGAGALNYGHNNAHIKRKLISYIESDGIIHTLDMHTAARGEFLKKFSDVILKPRELDYKVQFCGPTGTNAVEAALKLVRKITPDRTRIFSFMGSYHGVSLGSLSVTANRGKRSAAGLPLNNVTFFPYPSGSNISFDTIDYIEAVLNDSHSGIEMPAAIIAETVQAEGGVNVAPAAWLRRLRELCDKHSIVLICDDIQVGCGRTGNFFSFERAGIVPDIVLLSKSISGYGGPLSLLLMRPHLDVWEPGDHNGTFRGYQLALVGATAAIEFLQENDIEQEVRTKEAFLDSFLKGEIATLSERIDVRGIGMIWGIDVSSLGGRLAEKVQSRCFELGLIIETVGRDDTVLKLIPPLTIDLSLLKEGCSIIKQAFNDCL